MRRLVANTQSDRIVAEFEADLAEAQQDSTCTSVPPAELKRLVMLATIAEQLGGSTGGRRGRHRQRGGGLSDAVKRLLGSMCNLVSRGVSEAGRQQAEVLDAMAEAINNIPDEAAGAGLRLAFRRAVQGAATSAALYDLSYGIDGYVGSIVTAIASALYENSPSVSTALMSVVGAAEIVGTGAAAVAGGAVGVAAVTYASYLIMKGLDRAKTAARQLPNPTDPAQIHDILADVVGSLSRSRVQLGSYVAPRARGGLAGTMVIGPGRLPPGRNAAGAAFSAAALEDGQVELDAAAAAKATLDSLGMTLEQLQALRARNAARFGTTRGPAGAGAGSDSTPFWMRLSKPDGQGGKGRRRTRKHKSRRHHTRKH